MRKLSGLPSLQMSSDKTIFDMGHEGVVDARIVAISEVPAINYTSLTLTMKTIHLMYLEFSDIGTRDAMRSSSGGGGLGGVTDALNPQVVRRMNGILIRLDIRCKFDLGGHMYNP